MPLCAGMYAQTLRSGMILVLSCAYCDRGSIQCLCSRLTPAYLFVLGLVEVAMRVLHNSSVFEPKVMDHVNCDNYWWRNALYINSLYPRSEMVSRSNHSIQIMLLSSHTMVSSEKKCNWGRGT
jgi:hypothetical protein